MRVHQILIKRIFDLLLAFTGLLFFWPVIAVCVMISRWDTGLSGVFVQSRVGQHGRIVRVLKIRTMRKVNGINSTVTVSGDVRITDIGSFLRSWKLDELPQLWNVLLGDMSFVGPRPDVPGYADKLVGEDRKMLTLKPGITGPATIKYRNEEVLLGLVADANHYNDTVLYPDKVKINLDYMYHWSLLADVKYILMTVGLLPVPVKLTMPFDLSTE